jgi:hypothetical protein
MAERKWIGQLVNTFKVFGYGFCLERGWFTLIHPKKKKKTVCVWHAHQGDVVENQLNLNPASALKKLATHVGSMNSFPRLLDRLKSLKEPIHHHQWQTDRKIYAQWGGGNSVIRVLAGNHHWLPFHEHPVDRYICISYRWSQSSDDSSSFKSRCIYVICDNFCISSKPEITQESYKFGRWWSWPKKHYSGIQFSQAQRSWLWEFFWAWPDPYTIWEPTHHLRAAEIWVFQRFNGK